MISEITLETPDRLEVQNVGEAFDYSGYSIAVSKDPYPDINAINTITNSLGNMGANSVMDWNDDGGAGYWGNNIWWDNDGTGWIIVIDDQGNVVDSVFWNFTAAQISGLNVSINGFNVTAADLDWTGDGADFSNECFNSFRRNGDLDSSSDWSGLCENSDFGVANDDIALGFTGCLGDRTETIVTIEDVNPEITCPADINETVNVGELFTIPDYTGSTTATDNCTTSPAITQNPIAGTEVGEGVTVITMTATDEAGNSISCTFNLTVVEILGIEDSEFYNSIFMYPNPANERITLVNKTTEQLLSATIIDVTGRIIQKIDLSNSGLETNIQVENYANGVYFVRINAENVTIIKRFVKR